jgi:hypothetical protein
MWQDDKFITGVGAPGADIAVPGLDQVDGALILRSPTCSEHPLLRLVNLDKAARWQNGVHSDIVCPNVSIGVVLF